MLYLILSDSPNSNWTNPTYLYYPIPTLLTTGVNQRTTSRRVLHPVGVSSDVSGGPWLPGVVTSPGRERLCCFSVVKAWNTWKKAHQQLVKDAAGYVEVC